MVQLILSSPKGNQGGKYFPYLGYLGLTPVRVEGIVRTKLDTDLKLLPCTSLTISVRCYEQRLGRVNVTNSRILADHTETLWRKPDDLEYEPVGSSEYAFRIVLPTNIAGFSTATFVDYRCTWRVEAVLNHIPISGVGSRQIRHFEIPLIRFDLPKRVLLPSPAKSPVSLDQCTSKPRAPRIRYSFEAPNHAVGPSEPVSIPLHLQPLEPNVSIKNATVVVERRIHLLDPHPASASSPIPIPNPPFLSSLPSSSTHSSPSASPHSSPAPLSSSHSSYFSLSRSHPTMSPSEHASPEQASTSQHFEPAQSTASLVSSQPTITPNNVNPSTASLFSWTSDSPLIHSSSLAQQHQLPSQTPPMTASSTASSSSLSASKVVVNSIVVTETDAFTRDPKGLWSSTITLEWPASKSHSRWAVGETISSDLVSVKYYIRVKISVTSPANGTDTIELGEKELLVVSTNEQERQNAQATYAELVETGRLNDSALRSKSRSPRRLKPIERGDIPPSPAPYRGEGTSTSSAQQHGSTSSSGRAKTPRRPHTSAGPRDKPSFGQANGDPHKKRRSEAGWGTMGLPIAMGMSEQGAAQHATTKNGEMSKKNRSSSSGKLSSSSFWAVQAPPLKNHSSSSSSGGKNRSGGAFGTSSGTSTTASTSSISSGRSGRRCKGDSSCDEDDEEWRQRAGLASSRSGKLDSRNLHRPPPSSFNPAIVSQAEGGHGHSATMREWEEELTRIEEKSRKESDAAGFARMRKRSFISTMKDLFPSKKSSNAGGDESSS